jgi:hypothetical protein
MSEKKQRGRPKKRENILPFISNTETTTKDEIINTTYNCTNDYHEGNIILKNESIISNTPILENIKTEEKKRRGRPSKYKEEERKEKYKEKQKEVIKNWYQENKDEFNKQRKEKYKENSKEIKEASSHYQYRARNAHKLLAELLEYNIIQDETYRQLAIDLITNKNIIYTK